MRHGKGVKQELINPAFSTFTCKMGCAAQPFYFLNPGQPGSKLDKRSSLEMTRMKNMDKTIPYQPSHAELLSIQLLLNRTKSSDPIQTDARDKLEGVVNGDSSIKPDKQEEQEQA